MPVLDSVGARPGAASSRSRRSLRSCSSRSSPSVGLATDAQLVCAVAAALVARHRVLVARRASTIRRSARLATTIFFGLRDRRSGTRAASVRRGSSPHMVALRSSSVGARSAIGLGAGAGGIEPRVRPVARRVVGSIRPARASPASCSGSPAPPASPVATRRPVLRLRRAAGTLRRRVLSVGARRRPAVARAPRLQPRRPPGTSSTRPTSTCTASRRPPTPSSATTRPGRSRTPGTSPRTSRSCSCRPPNLRPDVPRLAVRRRAACSTRLPGRRAATRWG